MTKLEATSILDKLNKIITGSKYIVKAIDTQPENVQIYKALRASINNSIKLSEAMKEIIDKVVSSDFSEGLAGIDPFQFMKNK